MAETLNNSSNADPRTLRIWRFVDGKSGHEKQTLGLTEALSDSVTVVVQDFDVRTPSTWCAEIKARLQKRRGTHCGPDLIIGAGHATHWPMLMTRLFCGGRTVLLMSPSLPTRFFDLVFVPRHDRRREANNQIETVGVIGPTQQAEKDPRAGLILVGGVNRHFEWRDEKVLQQIQTLIRENPEVSWAIFDSRRTPESMMDTLTAIAEVEYMSWRDVTSDSLTSRLSSATQVWVTADSVSMLYEALTAGAVVGVIELPLMRPKRPNKLTRGLMDLREDNQIHLFHESPRLTMNHDARAAMSESRRCADIVLERLFIVA
ncbi:MAG: mitochondrial fission ELM1 family protein [Pseudomonadales bacterium]|nr:mitochondrial fission ELM1 family protein [Pseudomonadales bacterium]